MHPREPDVNHVSAFDAFIEGIVEETSTFVIRLTDGRLPLVFRKTRNWDDLEQIKKKVKDAVVSVQENTFPPAWRPFIGSNILPVGHAKWLSERHVGYLEWQDCEEPAEPTISHRMNGEQWQEEVLVPIPSGELTFLKMSAKDPHAFESLTRSFFDNVGVGWSSADASHFREAATTA